MYGTNGSSDGTVFLDDPATWASGSMPDSKKLEKTRINTRRIGYMLRISSALPKSLKYCRLRWSYVENMPTINTKF
jgi:iron complex outermembrane receptor protein